MVVPRFEVIRALFKDPPGMQELQTWVLGSGHRETRFEPRLLAGAQVAQCSVKGFGTSRRTWSGFFGPERSQMFFVAIHLVQDSGPF